MSLLGCVSGGSDDKKRLEEARGFWEQAVKSDGENADAHYHLSLYYKLTGVRSQLEKHLKKAVKLDGAHVAALRELRLLDMRKDDSEEGPESMGAFFKRIWGKLNKKKAPKEDTAEEKKDDWRKKKRKPTI